MKKIVRLTEADLTRLVKKIVKEQDELGLDEPHYQFDKEIGKKLGINSTEFDLSPYIKSNNTFNLFKTQYSSFISLSGGVI